MLYLASQSPRRNELLQQITTNFQIVSAAIDEVAYANERAEDFVVRMAVEKAQAGFDCIDSDDCAVLGSDTVVVINNHILGKPKDFDDFCQMMQMLSGQKHQVMTGVAIKQRQQTDIELVITNVEFAQLSPDTIKSYWQTGEPQDKAGGYGIQGLAARFIKRIEGSYTAVVGLPLFETEQLLIKAKII